MKKFLALTLALILCLSLVACGGDAGSNAKEDAKGGNSTTNDASAVVKKYIEEHEEEILESFSSTLTASGLTCEATIKTEGTRFILDVNVKELEDITDDQKASLQAEYDALQSTFDEALTDMQTELPELTGYTMNVRDVNGNLLATVKAGK